MLERRFACDGSGTRPGVPTTGQARATICVLAMVFGAAVGMPAGGVATASSLPWASGAGSRGEHAQTSLVYPVDVIAAGDGVVVADFKAPGLLEIDDTGAVSAIAVGDGLPRTPLYGTRALLDAPDGDGWLVADPATSSLYRVRADGSMATITNALDIPQGLARFDESSVLVSDLRSGLGAVMRVGLDGAVSVFAEIDSPKGIVEDGDSGFAVVSHGDRAVYRLSREGEVSALHRGEPLLFPHDLVRLPDGDFVVSDGYAHALFTVSGAGEVTVLAQGAPLVAPQGIARLANGTLIVVDPQAGAVFRVAPDGAVRSWVTVQGAGVGPVRR